MKQRQLRRELVRLRRAVRDARIDLETHKDATTAVQAAYGRLTRAESESVSDRLAAAVALDELDAELVGVETLADAFGVTRQTVTNWRIAGTIDAPVLDQRIRGPLWAREQFAGTPVYDRLRSRPQG